MPRGGLGTQVLSVGHMLEVLWRTTLAELGEQTDTCQLWGWLGLWVMFYTDQTWDLHKAVGFYPEINNRWIINGLVVRGLLGVCATLPRPWWASWFHPIDSPALQQLLLCP